MTLVSVEDHGDVRIITVNLVGFFLRKFYSTLILSSNLAPLLHLEPDKTVMLQS